jgi:hypothetical protein
MYNIAGRGHLYELEFFYTAIAQSLRDFLYPDHFPRQNQQDGVLRWQETASVYTTADGSGS